MSEPVLPRPGATYSPKDPIPGPSEEAFTSTFGAFLPRAQFLHTNTGKAAYYTFVPTHPSPASGSPQGPARVLLVHGVQTPALGLLPLTAALRAQFPSAAFVLLDLWGHGLSDTPVVPHTGELFHALLDRLLAHLGWHDEVHVVGFSFGAVLTMGFVARPVARTQVSSFALVAPAGLVRKAWFTDEERVWLGRECKVEDERRARDWVVSVLEGGELVVPGDWRKRVQRGEVVAEAVRDWQMGQHKGHAASVVGVFRDGGVTDNDQLFVEARETGIPSLVVLGEDDDLSTKKEVVDFGFDVKVVPNAGHGVVRDKAGEVAEHIAEFWKGLS